MSESEGGIVRRSRTGWSTEESYRAERWLVNQASRKVVDGDGIRAAAAEGYRLREREGAGSAGFLDRVARGRFR